MQGFPRVSLQKRFFGRKREIFGASFLVNPHLESSESLCVETPSLRLSESCSIYMRNSTPINHSRLVQACRHLRSISKNRTASTSQLITRHLRHVTGGWTPTSIAGEEMQTVSTHAALVVPNTCYYSFSMIECQ
jgi:hypothetical protein